MRTKSRPAAQKPTTDFAEVKRRFIRQNRELAKCNSSQSLQIRNLQIESQRLLSENLELREQLLQVQNETHRAKRKAARAERFTLGLQTRLAELLSFINNGTADDGDSPSDGEDQELRRLQASMQGHWRERIPLTEAMRENQMPTIAEDKLYPRRTLNANEILGTRLSDHSSNGSPDLGPPPVAHLDYEDPIKHDSPARTESPTKQRDDPLTDGLSMNLEVRRKRKDVHPKTETRRHSIVANSPVKPEGESSILRVGAKRKLADRDLEVPAIRTPKPEDFEFSRKASCESVEIGLGSMTAQVSERPVKPPRKVLGDKSVNMSPRKASNKADADIKRDPEKPAVDSIVTETRPPSRGRRSSSIPVPSPPHEMRKPEIVKDELSGMRPVTPATADLFSPTTSQPSTGANVSCDTPPPGDLSNLSTLSITSETGRQSRRARSAVNYAEPSLVSKMRRPGKEMADAVTGLQDPRRTMSVSTARSVSIKKEPMDDEAWKSESTTSNPPTSAAIGSPLEQRSTTESKQFSLDAVVIPRATEPDKPSTSSVALSALIAESKKRRGSMDRVTADLSADDELAAATKRLEEMDLYEFKDSSSPDGETIKARKPSIKAGRRHTLDTKESSEPASTTAMLKTARKTTANTTAKAASRRKSMMI